MTWEGIVAHAKNLLSDEHPVQAGLGVDGISARQLATQVVQFDADVKAGAKLPASWQPFAVHLAGYEKQSLDDAVPGQAKGVHEESRDGGRTWVLVSTPASGQVELIDGVMVRKALPRKAVR